MSITRAKHTATRRPARVPAGGQPIAEGPQPVFPDAREAILAARDEIVAGLIEKAKRGSYLHAKFLFDFAGLNPAAEAEAAAYAREASLARLLLDHLASEGLIVPGYEGFAAATAARGDESV
jgi:hypothetical protein